MRFQAEEQPGRDQGSGGRGCGPLSRHVPAFTFAYAGTAADSASGVPDLASAPRGRRGTCLAGGGARLPWLGGTRRRDHRPAAKLRAGRMAGTRTGAARLEAAPRRIAGQPHSLPGVLGNLRQHADGLWHHAFTAQPLPPRWLVLGSAALALAIVASLPGLAGRADRGDDRARGRSRAGGAGRGPPPGRGPAVPQYRRRDLLDGPGGRSRHRAHRRRRLPGAVAAGPRRGGTAGRRAPDRDAAAQPGAAGRARGRGPQRLRHAGRAGHRRRDRRGLPVRPGRGPGRVRLRDDLVPAAAAACGR